MTFTGLTGPQPVTYGSEVVLQDTLSLVTTAPLFIKKVDKGKISDEEGGPVSQMQKIALQRVNPDGSRHYLSAAGPLPGATGVVAPPPAPGSASQTGTHHLLFSPARVREEVKDGARLVHDEVDDYLCWTIVGICTLLLLGGFKIVCTDCHLQLNFNTHSSTLLVTLERFPRCQSHHFLHSSQRLPTPRQVIQWT